MIEKLLKKYLKKETIRETVSYVVVGVMTTLVDWGYYRFLRYTGVGYQMATAGSWAAAVLFAYVANKFFVFCSMTLRPRVLWKEFSSFVTCRVATGLFTLVAMIVLVDGMGIKRDFICKVVLSAVSLILNYVFSKLVIFKKSA